MSDSFYQILTKRIRELESLTDGARGALYREVSRILDEHIASADPALTSEQAGELLRDLNVAIEQIENEFVEARASGKRGPGWAWTLPPSIDDAEATRKRSDQEFQRSALEFVGPEGEIERRAEEGAQRLLAAQARQMERDFSLLMLLRNLVLRINIITALVRRYLHTSAGTERLGYMWTLCEPLIQISVVVGVYWLFGKSYIYNMPALPFAVIGISGWLMMRMMLTRAGMGLGAEFSLCTFPIIQPIDIKIAKSIFYGITYFGVLVVCLLLVWYFGVAEVRVKDPLRFFGYWVLFWCFSFGSALCLGRFLAVFPWSVHFILVFFRILMLVSGVVFISEQIPRDIRIYVLWNPIMHGMQLLRSAFFNEYESTDASLLYFVTATVVAVTLGLMLDKANYREAIAP